MTIESIWTVLLRVGGRNPRIELFSYASPEDAKSQWDSLVEKFGGSISKAFPAKEGVCYAFRKSGKTGSISIVKHPVLRGSTEG